MLLLIVLLLNQSVVAGKNLQKVTILDQGKLLQNLFDLLIAIIDHLLLVWEARGDDWSEGGGRLG